MTDRMIFADPQPHPICEFARSIKTAMPIPEDEDEEARNERRLLHRIDLAERVKR